MLHWLQIRNLWGYHDFPPPLFGFLWPEYDYAEKHVNNFNNSDEADANPKVEDSSRVTQQPLHSQCWTVVKFSNQVGPKLHMYLQ